MKKVYETFWKHYCEVERRVVYIMIGSKCRSCGETHDS